MTARKPKTHTAYQTLRRESPRQYHSPTVQAQMLEDRSTLGHDAFYNTEGEENRTELADEISKVIANHLRSRA